jgi:alkylhydroperoxidase family enzyme
MIATTEPLITCAVCTDCSKDEDLVARIQEDFRAAGLDPKTPGHVGLLEKLTLTPGAMEHSYVEALRIAGFIDADILAIVEATGYYAYVNRIAEGLGVQVEERLVRE